MFDFNVRMIEDVKKGKRILNPVIYFVVAWIFYILANIFVVLVTDFLLVAIIGQEAAAQPFPYLVSMLFSFIFYALMVLFFVRFIEGRKISSLGLYAEGWLKSLCIGIFWGLLLISIAIGIFAIMGNVEIESPATQPIGFSALPYVLVLFFAFLVQGGTEEIVNRGWLLNVVSAKYNIIIGFLVSTLYFCSVHMFNTGFNFIVIINIILFSLFLCIFVFRKNNIWCAIGFHGAWNFAIGNLFGMDVSGVKMGAGSIFDLNVSGSELLAGGTFGIEGGVIISAVLILGIIGQLIILKTRSSTPPRSNIINPEVKQ